MHLDLLYITILTVFVVDLSGFRATFLRLASLLFRRPLTELKPFTCSLCVTWWAGFAYLLATDLFTWGNLAYVAALSFATYPIAQAGMLARDLILKLISILQDKL